MAFTPEQLTKMRQELGLAETADEATIVAALSEALAEQAEDAPAAPQVPEGMSLVSTAVLSDLQSAATEGRTARAQQLQEHQDRTIAAAITDGRIRASEKEHYDGLWAIDAAKTESLLKALTPGLVPVDERGHAETPVEDRNATVDDTALDTFATQIGLTKEDLR